MNENIYETRKRLRNYLRSYRRHEERAANLEKDLAANKVQEPLKTFLTKEMEASKSHCANVLTIFYFLPQNGLTLDIMTMRYINGLSFKKIAAKLLYSEGYISNVDAAAIAELAEDKAVLQLIKQP